MNSNTEAVLFDFDGTLAPNLDLPQMRREVIELTRAVQIPTSIYEGQYIVEIIEASHRWLYPKDKDRADQYRQQAHQLITDIELGAAANTAPFEFTPDVLHTLRKQGCKLGIVTRNCRAAVLKVFPALLDHVDTLCARDDVTHLKPDPKHLQQALDQLGCDPATSVMIGDGRLDMHSGRQLDMYCIGVLTGSSNQIDLTSAGAHEVLPSCQPLAGWSR